MSKSTNIFDIISDESKTDLILNIDPVLTNGHLIEVELKKIASEISGKNVNLNLNEIENYDSFLIILVNKFKNIKELKDFNISSDDEELLSYIENLSKYLVKEEDEEGENWLYQYFYGIGSEVKKQTKDLKDFVTFIGELFTALTAFVIKPNSIRWNDLPFQFMKSGVNALGIVLLILFLIGTITGYQGSLQLSRFGADTFISDLVGISITRELAPLMTAIIVAGRSGSAFAAEIGTMKVSEEIDSLNTLGFNIQKFIVIPRVLAVTIAMPLLTILADLMGILGGLLAATQILDVTASGYFSRMQSALSISDVFTGLFKAGVFGFLIAAIGCFRGLQVRGGAQSVGKFTTASVVTGILFIIVFDTLFTFVFQAIGW